MRDTVSKKYEKRTSSTTLSARSRASVAAEDYVKFQAVIKWAACAASLRGGRASGRLDHGFFFAIFGRASGQKIFKISDSVGLHVNHVGQRADAGHPRVDEAPDSPSALTDPWSSFATL